MIVFNLKRKQQQRNIYRKFMWKKIKKQQQQSI